MDLSKSYISEFLKLIKRKLNNKIIDNKISSEERGPGLHIPIQSIFRINFNMDFQKMLTNKRLFRRGHLCYVPESSKSLEDLNLYLDNNIFWYLNALNDDNEQKTLNKKIMEKGL